MITQKDRDRIIEILNESYRQIDAYKKIVGEFSRVPRPELLAAVAVMLEEARLDRIDADLEEKACEDLARVMEQVKKMMGRHPDTVGDACAFLAGRHDAKAAELLEALQLAVILLPGHD